MRLAEQPISDAPAVAWEECLCPCCGSASFKPLLEADDALKSGLRFLIVQCASCGLCFTNPRPDPASMDRFYPDDYRCHRITPHTAKSDAMERWLPSDRPARLLDFGCGAGAFLLRMRERGWHVTGLDRADAVAMRLREQHGLNAHAGTLPHPHWPDACFEAITMRQSLEHVHAPLEVLRDSHRLLSAGGRLLVSVPNFDGLAAHWFGPTWYGLDLPRHLTHFTPQSLRTMLLEAGFADITMRQEAHASWIRHSARRGILATRLGSGIASRWARILGRSEGLLALAVK
jgi:SAM-dependent methyltransferase